MGTGATTQLCLGDLLLGNDVWIAGKGGLSEDPSARTPRQGRLLKSISWTTCELVLSCVSCLMCFAAANDSYRSGDPPHHLNAQHHCATPSKAPSLEAAATNSSTHTQSFASSAASQG